MVLALGDLGSLEAFCKGLEGAAQRFIFKLACK